MKLFFLLLLAGFMQAARSFTEGGMAPAHGTALAFGYVLLSAFLAGSLFRGLRLPRLTGYLVVGVVAGPHGLELLNDSMVDSLGLVNGAAISLIALGAGVEMDLRAMRPLVRPVAWISLLAVVGTSLLLAAACLLMRGSFDFLREAPIHQAVATSVVLGTVMVAQSPAVVVALRDETSAEGPMIRTVLAVVVIADLLVIVLFALSSAGAKAAFGVAGALGATLATLAWQVLGSFLAGTLMGALLALYLRKVRGGAALFVLTVAFVMAEVGGRLAFDPLLVALVAGIFVRSLSAAHERLAQAVGASGLPIYAVFFAVAGARIHLDALGKLAWPLVVLFLVRAAGLVGGTRIAARIAAAPPEVRRYAGWGLVPRGLALALALLFAKLFPEFGAEGVSLAVGLVALNELTAPIAFRFALVRSGEAGRRAAPADLEFGAAADPSESEALALDRRAPG